MLKKLATHDVQDVAKLFSLMNKCASATEGHAWHSQPASEAGKIGKPDVDAAARSSRKKKKKKKDGSKDKPLVDARTATTATLGGGRGPHGDKRT
jgi:PAB1-binding protein PBP1